MNLSLVLALCAVMAPLKSHHRMKTPSYLSTVAREELDARMEDHGVNVMRLSMSVVLLEYEDTAEAAQRIVSELGIQRGAGNKSTLDASLPPRFFDFQEQLRARAQSLANAAAKRSAPEMSVAYTRLTETCIACHSLYLNGREDPIDIGH